FFLLSLLSPPFFFFTAPSTTDLYPLSLHDALPIFTPLANSRSFPLRHAVLHLSRPGNQTRVILLAVGLGACFIVGVRSLQATLLDEFSVQVSNESPDMFLLDVQRGQVDGVRAFLSDPANAA